MQQKRFLAQEIASIPVQGFLSRKVKQTSADNVKKQLCLWHFESQAAWGGSLQFALLERIFASLAEKNAEAYGSLLHGALCAQ